MEPGQLSGWLDDFYLHQLPHFKPLPKEGYELPERDPDAFKWRHGKKFGVRVSYKVLDCRESAHCWSAAAARHFSLTQHSAAGHLMPYLEFFVDGQDLLLITSAHSGCLLDAIMADRIHNSSRLQLFTDMLQVVAQAKRTEQYVQLNPLNLVVFGAGGVQDASSDAPLRQPGLKLAAFDTSKSWSKRGMLFVAEVMVSDVPAGVDAGFVTCSPAEAVFHRSPQSGAAHVLTEGDLMFRVGLVLHLIETGTHPGGTTPQQQLDWIVQMGCTKTAPVLSATISYGMRMLLQHLLDGDPKRRFGLNALLGTVVRQEKNAQLWLNHLAEVVDNVKEAQEGTPAFQMRQQLEYGKGSGQEDMPWKLIFDGKPQLQDVLTTGVMRLLMFRDPGNGLDTGSYSRALGGFDATSPWLVMMRLRNVFGAHPTQEREDAVKAAGFKEGSLGVYKALVANYPDWLAVVAEMEERLGLDKLVCRWRSTIHDDLYKGASASTAPLAGEDKHAVHAFLQTLSLAPDARGVAAPPGVSGQPQPGQQAAGGGSGGVQGDTQDEDGRQAAGSASSPRGQQWGIGSARQSHSDSPDSKSPAGDAAGAATAGTQQQQQQQQQQQVLLGSSGLQQQQEQLQSQQEGDEPSRQPAHSHPAGQQGPGLSFFTTAAKGEQRPAMEVYSEGLTCSSDASEGEAAGPMHPHKAAGAASQQAQQQQQPQQPVPRTNLEAVHMDHGVDCEQYCFLPFALAPPMFRSSHLSKLLRHGRVVFYGLRFVQYHRQMGSISDGIALSLLHSYMHDAVFGRIHGPAVVELCAEVLDLAFTCDRQAVAESLPAISESLPAAATRLARLLLERLYQHTRALPAAVPAELAQKLRVLLPLSKLVAPYGARPGAGFGLVPEAVTLMAEELEEQEEPLTADQQQLQKVLTALHPSNAQQRDFCGLINAYVAASPDLRRRLTWPLQEVVGTPKSLQILAAQQLAASSAGRLSVASVAESIAMHGATYLRGCYLPVYSNEPEDKKTAQDETDELLRQYCSKHFTAKKLCCRQPIPPVPPRA